MHSTFSASGVHFLPRGTRFKAMPLFPCTRLLFLFPLVCTIFSQTKISGLKFSKYVYETVFLACWSNYTLHDRKYPERRTQLFHSYFLKRPLRTRRKTYNLTFPSYLWQPDLWEIRFMSKKGESRTQFTSNIPRERSSCKQSRGKDTMWIPSSMVLS